MLRVAGAFIASFVIVSWFVGHPPIKLPYPIAPPTIEIASDGGGMVGDYDKFYTYLRAAGIHVKITGACVSACTLVLSLPKDEVCVGPAAKFGFHLATEDGIPNMKVTQDLIRWYYPEEVQKWIEQHGPLTSDVIYMTAQEAIQLGVVKACEE